VYLFALKTVLVLPEEGTTPLVPMSKLTIRSLAELEQHEGQDLGASEFFRITQEQINRFAEATLDHQWIHVDAERAKTDSPFGNTIAHGYLTLALLPYLWNQIVTIENLKMQVNYEIESLRFNQPVLVNSEVRLLTKLLSVKNLRGIAKARIEVILEIKDVKKPAYTGIVTFLYHFVE
jgi:acyl dehydratase